ncbi:HD domain-containing phosphohydrolase [Cupriavidus pauculus]|uniref:HD domain-containing phosphohydrolase n=1 Tax=Cupriavidus pauculus TaxID=82633 RepID=UPI001EE20E6E|nr:HD domain-containing phosphohydrolase [Cupriavidus pauculus]GJG96764.1 HD domain-containing protein [Cupriavidus pauculus]
MRSNKGISLPVYLWMLFGSIVVVVGVLACGVNYWMTKAALETATSDATRRIGSDMLDEVHELLAPAEAAVRLVRHSSLASARNHDERMARLALAREALESAPILQALFIGYADGAFFYVRPLRSATDRTFFNAPSTAAYLVRSVNRNGGSPNGRIDFFDSELVNIWTADDTDYALRYDPRLRTWYQDAIAADAPVRTEPYIFFANHEAGESIAFRTPDGQAVVGGDFDFEALGKLLAKKKATANTVLALLDSDGRVIGIDRKLPEASIAPDAQRDSLLAAPADYGIPVLTAMAPRSSGPPTLGHAMLSAGGRQWYATTSTILAGAGKPFYLLSAVPEDELLASARRQAVIGMAITIAIVLLSMPVLWIATRHIAKPLGLLADDLSAVRKFDFDHPLSVHTHIREINTLVRATEQMRQTIRRFLVIVQAISAEGRLEQLLPVLLKKTLNEAGGAAGVFYRVDDRNLVVAAAQNRSGEAVPSDPVKLKWDQVPPLLRDALRHGQPQCGYLRKGDCEAIAPLAMLNEGESHAVAIPLVNRQRELQGLILILRETPMEASQLAFLTTLSSLFAGAIEVRELTRAQRELFDAFIRLLADAIDAKSPHTGGHCARVPELVKMLAEAACEAKDGPYRSFSMTEGEWEALHVAAWLHDCGKVTTPEFIIDKATKLETLYDRIHEVRMRFEVLKREAEIDCLRGILAGDDSRTAETQLQQTLSELDEDFAFVAECNQGGESMDEARRVRLKKVATRTWTRTLDDCLGVSQQELGRKRHDAAPALPVREPLLSDKPEHLIPRSAADRIPSDNPWGFRRNAPVCLYQRGELHNLMVARGTLCEEERYKIEDHIVQTQVMLSRLPFPKHLRQVPEIAGNHHEKMDGTGYPRQLRREEMSPLSRMMAIADIFEALTAADRPYKKAKTLSESIDIMARAAKQQHIDAELFELFLRSGVYQRYAQRFMREEQRDAVDVGQYLERTN